MLLKIMRLSGIYYLWIFNQTGHKFIFVIDEWDAVFHSSFITEKDKKDYLPFFKVIAKRTKLCRTGIYDRCASNRKIFGRLRIEYVLEYNMATRVRFSEYFGFLMKKWICCISAI